MCKLNTSTIAAAGIAVGNALKQIAAAEEAQGNTTIAANLITAANTLEAATANWKTGSPIDDINTAAQVVEAILAVIPMTAPYATFVAIAVTALDIIIATVNTQAAQTPNVVANHLLVEEHIDTLPENPYRGLVVINPGIRGYGHAVQKRWNRQVEDEPLLKFSKI